LIPQQFSNLAERSATGWVLVQKPILNFSGLFHKLEDKQPSGSVLSDLLVLQHSPKWNNLSKKQALNQEAANPVLFNLNPLTPALQEETNQLEEEEKNNQASNHLNMSG
ncbi:hypothetical protein VP01_6903g1, partial [Puccinia sorghi]